MRKFYFTFFTILFTLIHSQAQFNKSKLNEFFDALEQNDKFNGSVALSQNGNIIYERSVGFADVENNLKINNQTLFRIGSISKTYTATLIMMAVEENRISIDQSIDKFFPQLEKAENISIEMLLNHRSGIFNITADPTYLTWNTQPQTKADLLSKIANYKRNFEPGQQLEYSNSNYILLTFILEEIYQKSYAEILDEKIVKPLDLNRTKVGDKINSSNNEANSYQLKGSTWVKFSESDLSIPLGAGVIISTPKEVIQFGVVLFNEKLVSSKTLDQMIKLNDGFGYGLISFPFNDKRSFGHTGGIDQFSSMWAYFPEEKVSFAIVSNGSDISNNDIAIAMLSSVFDVEIDIPTFKSRDEIEAGIYGTFYNGQIGMHIQVNEHEGQVFAQATGQMPFPLEKVSETVYTFEMGGIEIEYAEDLKSFTLKQGGGEYVFNKE